MKIAIYIPTASFIVGGAEVVSLMQAKYLHRRGHNITIIVYKVDNETTYFENFKRDHDQIKIVYIDIPKYRYIFKNKDFSHSQIHTLYFGISRESQKYFIYNQHFEYVISHYSPAAISVPSGIKHLLILHGLPSHWEAISHSAVRLVDRVIAVSRATSNGWQEMHDYKNISVLHNGIDENYFKPKDIDEVVDIIFVGRLIKIKGVQYLIKAISVLTNFDNLKVVIGGTGPEEKKLKKLSCDLKINDKVSFVGFIPDGELVNYYHKSKIAVFPSYSREGVLTTMLEAASCGKCIITSNCCGMTDFITHNRNGLLVKPKDYESIASAIELCLSNKSLRNKLGRKARSEVLKRWTWNRSIIKLEKILKKI